MRILQTSYAMSEAVLSAKKVSKSFKGPEGNDIRAVIGLDLELESGEFIVINGASGCGKSTLLLIAGALLRPDKGEIKIMGEEPYVKTPSQRAEIRAKQIGFVFQQFHLVPYLDALDNVLASTLSLPFSNADERARKILSDFGLANRMHHIPSSLSVGEQQRVALARALIGKPSLLIADEPTGNLDSKNSEIILDELKSFAEKGGAVLMATHDERATQCASRILNMQEGRILED